MEHQYYGIWICFYYKRLTKYKLASERVCVSVNNEIIRIRDNRDEEITRECLKKQILLIHDFLYFGVLCA